MANPLARQSRFRQLYIAYSNKESVIVEKRVEKATTGGVKGVGSVGSREDADYSRNDGGMNVLSVDGAFTLFMGNSPESAMYTLLQIILSRKSHHLGVPFAVPHLSIM